MDLGAAPAGSDLSSLGGVACSSATSCIAVGSSASKRSGIFGPGALAERWDGSSWTSLGAQNPSAAFHGSVLSAISCQSAAACVAVGQYFPGNGPVAPLAETWDGTAWTIQSTPTPPTAATVNLQGVSCPAATACMAVGPYSRNTGVPQTLAEAWNGTSWQITVTLDQTGSQISGLDAVSCPSSNACMAVGSAASSNGVPGVYAPYVGARLALSEWYDGSSWQIRPVATPPVSLGVTLRGVSCTAVTACTAVGYYENVQGTRVTLAERWDGQDWLLQRTPNPANLEGATLRAVSCTAADACTAVGTFTDNSGMDATLVEHWDGQAWSIQPSPNPPDSQADTLESVSCTGPSNCIASGFYIAADASGLGTRDYALAERWNGSGWSIQAVPDPVPGFGATSGDSFSGVSCVSATSCFAVGNYETFDRPYPVPSLVEHWDGQAWYWQPTPNPAVVSDALENLAAISCTSATNCEAVGYYYGGSGTDAGIHTFGEHLAGTTWTLDSTAEPPGTRQAELDGLACPGPQGCVAVGHFSYGQGTIGEDRWPAFTLTERYGPASG